LTKTKLYQFWQNHGYEGWNMQDFDTLEEALKCDTYGDDWFITKRVDWKVKEEGNQDE
jgi:hypothetical protein